MVKWAHPPLNYLRNFIICADGLTFNEQGLASLPNFPPPHMFLISLESQDFALHTRNA